MPELRSGPRRGRAQLNPVAKAARGVAPATRRRGAAARRNETDDANDLNSPVQQEEIGLVEGEGEGWGDPEGNKEEGVADRRMDEFDSGGRNADKLPGAEEEGSTAPLPEKVRFHLRFLVTFSYKDPVHYKGGFFFCPFSIST